jgi:DNA modification methylase
MTTEPLVKPLTDLQVHEVPIAELVLYPGNARRGDIDKIAESLEQHGQYRPIIVRRETGEVLAGNHTLQASQQLGRETILVQYLDGLTDQQARKIVLVDNKTSDAGGYDELALARLLDELEGDHTGTGWDDTEIADLLAQLHGEPEAKTDVDDVPEPAGAGYQPITKTGDLWLLGPHRLVVGDGTDPAVVEQALNGELADAYITDPPYNVDYVGKTADALQISNDAMTPEGFAELLRGLFTAAAQHLVKGGAAYIYYASVEAPAFRAAMEAAGLLYKQDLIWVKDRFVLSRQDYHWQHEPILYGWKAGAAHAWYGDFTPSTLIDDQPDPRKLSKAQLLDIVLDLYEHTTAMRENRPGKSTDHPTSKPVGSLVRHLQNSTATGGLVLDSCGGSGSIVIAAHTARRRAAVVELDPRFADVICRRWQAHTGVKPVKGKRSRDFVAHHDTWAASR